MPRKKGANCKKPRDNTETKKSKKARRVKEAERRNRTSQERIDYHIECQEKSEIGFGFGF